MSSFADETHQLLIIAGGNGAGKSSASKYISPPKALIYDPDKEIKRIESQYPDLPAASIYYAVQNYFLDQVDYIQKNKFNFTIETNFRDAGLMDTIERFREAGYSIGMVYMLLPNIQLSMERVNNRVREGGHAVDEDSIRTNFYEGQKNLLYFASRFDHIELINAAGEPGKLRSLLSIISGELAYYSENPPEWAKEMVDALIAPYGKQLDRNPWNGHWRNNEDEGRDYRPRIGR